MVNFIDKKVQQKLLKQAMETAWVASTCIGMVYAPLFVALEAGGADTALVRMDIGEWLRHWQDIRNQSDRNLHLNRDHHQIRPNEILSPILAHFEEELESARSLESSEDMLRAVKSAYMAVLQELFDFNELVKSAGSYIGFNAAGYKEQAVSKAQRYWGPVVKQLWEGL